MANSKTSSSSSLKILGSLIATISVGFGINAIIRPENAISFFEFEYPASGPTKTLVDNLLIIYGIRDIFMGFAIYIAAYFGDRKSLGWMLISNAAVAFGDGAVCWTQGNGHWNHWGYAPIIALVGSLVLGIAG